MENVHKDLSIRDWLVSFGFEEQIADSVTQQDDVTWSSIKTADDSRLEGWGISDGSLRKRLLDAFAIVKVHGAEDELDELDDDESEDDDDHDGIWSDYSGFSTFQEVEEFPGLFIGSYDSARNRKLLMKFNITHILTVGSHMDPAFPNKLIYKIVEAYDMPDQNLLQFFPECHDFIDTARKQGKNVLVHCQAGISRASTMTISYMMRESKMPYDHCFSLVKRVRPFIYPNDGFVKQIHLYERMEYRYGGKMYQRFWLETEWKSLIE